MGFRDRARQLFEGSFSVAVLAKFLAAIVFGFGVGLALRPDPTTVPSLGPVSSQFLGAAVLAGGALAIAAIRWRQTEGGR